MGFLEVWLATLRRCPVSKKRPTYLGGSTIISPRSDWYSNQLMQRGMLKRRGKPHMTKQEEYMITRISAYELKKARPTYNQTKITMTASEQCHFDFGSVRKADLLASLKPVIRIFARGGIRTPRAVAKALNREGTYTACGEHWTPRLGLVSLEYAFPNLARIFG
jgi:hypothetical protein